MNDNTRRQIELAQRVRTFAQAYPSTDAAYPLLVARITAVADRVEALHIDHVRGLGDAKAASRNLGTVRVQLRELLRHVGKAAALAAQSGTVLKHAYPLPNTGTSLVKLSADAQSALSNLAVDAAALRLYGLIDATVTDLTGVIAQLQQTLDARDIARNTHVGARTEMKAALRDLRVATELLDTVNVLRFAGTSSELAEWNRLKRLLGAPRTTAASPKPSAPAQAPDVRPAA